MKKMIVLLVLLFSTNNAIADCSAPELAFELHDGNISGFRIVKLLDESEAGNINKDHDTLIQYGDYTYLVTAEDADKRPTRLNIHLPDISRTLLNNLQTSPHYLGVEKQIFTVSGIEVYDLSGDAEEDLILFNVSPGANVYSGAVGVIDGAWKTLIKPSCY